MKLSTQLKRFRVKNHFTQEQVANEIHVSRKTISSWENGRSNPDYQSLERLSKIYHTSFENQLNGNQSQNHGEKNTIIFLRLLLILNAISMTFCIINLFWGIFKYVLICQIVIDTWMLVYFGSSIHQLLVSKKIISGISILILLFFTNAQFDKIYQFGYISERTWILIPIFGSFLHALIMTYGFVILILFKSVYESVTLKKSS